MVELSIILVNWNCIAFTEQCIASIEANGQGLDYEVIVVDNDSGDAPCAELCQKFPWVKLVLSKQNIGFGRANNLGVRGAKGDYLLFLNPDTLVQGNALQQMLTALKSSRVAGALGCKLLNSDHTLQITSVLGFPTVINQLLAIEWLQRRWPTLPLWRKQALYSNRKGELQEVDAVSGAAILVRRKAFEDVGGFNPEYFMYAEEVDLCYALHQAQWKVVHLNSAEIIHFGGQSTKNREDGFTAITMHESIFCFLYQTRGALNATVYRLGLFVSAVCRLALLVCMLPFSLLVDDRGRQATVIRTFHKWLSVAIWSVARNKSFPGTSYTASGKATPAEN